MPPLSPQKQWFLLSPGTLSQSAILWQCTQEHRRDTTIAKSPMCQALDQKPPRGMSFNLPNEPVTVLRSPPLQHRKLR